MQEVHTYSAEPYDPHATVDESPAAPKSVYFNVMLCETTAEPRAANSRGPGGPSDSRTPCALGTPFMRTPWILSR